MRWLLAVTLALTQAEADDHNTVQQPQPREFFWNVASANNSEIQRNLSTTLPNIVFNQVILLTQNFGLFPW